MSPNGWLVEEPTRIFAGPATHASPFRGCRHSSPELPACGGTSLALVKLTTRVATVQLAETFTISRGSEDDADVVQVEVEHEGVSGHRRGGPDRALSRRSAASALAWLDGVELGDDPFALDEIAAGLPPGEQAARAAVDARAARPAGQAHRTAGVQVARLAPHGPADLLDDLARRSRRHGAPDGEDRRARVQAAEAETRRPRRPRRRSRPRRAAGD